MTRPLAYDLFCGAGGASLGLEYAGFDVVGWDSDPAAAATHRAAGFPTYTEHLTDETDWTERARPALLWASPPCQPFSHASSGRSTAEDGTPAFLHAVTVLRPVAVIMENVPALSWRKHRAVLDGVLAELAKLRYAASYRILNAADYGVPQARRRLFLVASLAGPPWWPVRTHGEWALRPHITMAEALPHRDDLPRWAHERPATTVQSTKRIGRPGHKDWSGEGEQQFARDAVRVSPEEAATLQGFPDGYPFVGATKATLYRLIGNAVPPQLAMHVARANMREASQ